MYIKMERNDAELSINKISSKKELINEIKILSNTLSYGMIYNFNLTKDDITKNNAAKNSNIKNIIKLENISENTERILSELAINNPIKIKSNCYTRYHLYIEIDENNKIEVTATSDIDPNYSWDTLIHWFPASEKDEF